MLLRGESYPVSATVTTSTAVTAQTVKAVNPQRLPRKPAVTGARGGSVAQRQAQVSGSSPDGAAAGRNVADAASTHCILTGLHFGHVPTGGASASVPVAPVPALVGHE